MRGVIIWPWLIAYNDLAPEKGALIRPRIACLPAWSTPLILDTISLVVVFLLVFLLVILLSFLSNSLLMESSFDSALFDGTDFTDAVLSRIQQKQLCSMASGTNSSTGVETAYSLGCWPIWLKKKEGFHV